MAFFGACEMVYASEKINRFRVISFYCYCCDEQMQTFVGSTWPKPNHNTCGIIIVVLSPLLRFEPCGDCWNFLSHSFTRATRLFDMSEWMENRQNEFERHLEFWKQFSLWLRKRGEEMRSSEMNANACNISEQIVFTFIDRIRIRTLSRHTLDYGTCTRARDARSLAHHHQSLSRDWESCFEWTEK